MVTKAPFRLHQYAGIQILLPVLCKALLQSTYRICFYGALRKIIPYLSSNIPPYMLLLRIKKNDPIFIINSLYVIMEN